MTDAPFAAWMFVFGVAAGFVSGYLVGILT